MKIYKHKAKAYAVLVKARKYILSEDERENKKQELVPAEYVEAVAMELISNLVICQQVFSKVFEANS